MGHNTIPIRQAARNAMHQVPWFVVEHQGPYLGSESHAYEQIQGPHQIQAER